MPARYVCPQCGESTNVEVLRFSDDEGRAKIRVTCRLLVHEQPVVQEFDDPDVHSAADLTPADGLVHDMDLYNKLETVVHRLEQPAEYGVVEHHFAMEFPEEYRALWRRYGHVATHGSKRYTLSAYLSRLLGNLARHGSVAHQSCVGTGRWAYNADVSAWSTPQRAHLPVQSWAEFARSNGWEPTDWPANELIPAEDYPEHADPTAAAPTRTLDPAPLVTWLQSKQVTRGAARQQPAIPLDVDWASAITDAGSSKAAAALARVRGAAELDGLTRNSLFTLATQDDWEALHLAVLIWGYGRFGQLTHNSAIEAFLETDADNRAEICEKVRVDTYIAWSRWWPADRQSTLPGLGVAMGTKLLYFAGYDSPTELKPLIYDRRVHGQLTELGYKLAHPDGRRTLVRWTSQYRPYLELCAAAATELCIEPEDAEHELFRAA